MNKRIIYVLSAMEKAAQNMPSVSLLHTSMTLMCL